MKIDNEKIEYIANLSRVYLDPKDVEYFSVQLNTILEYMQRLNKLDVTNIEPTSHVVCVKNVFRDDTVKDSLKIDDVLSNAIEKKNNMFKVAKTIVTD